jgi:hypothetical protein
VEQAEMATVRQWHAEQVSAAMDTHTTDKQSEAVFSTCPTPRLHENWTKQLVIKRELHDSQSRETVKYGNESHRTQNQGRLCWKGPVAIYLTWAMLMRQ